MRIIGAIALGLFAAASAGAQDDRHVVAPDNNWSITESDCSIDAGWDDEVAVLVTRHEDHHDLGVYDPRFKGMGDGKVAKVGLSPGGTPPDVREYDAATNSAGGSRSYVMAVDDAMLDALAASGTLQLLRDRKALADLDISGFDGALAAMRVCEAASPVALDITDADAGATGAMADTEPDSAEPQ